MAQENVPRSCQVVEKPIVWGDTSLRDCWFCCDFCDSCQGFALSGNSGPCRVRGSWIDNSRTRQDRKSTRLNSSHSSISYAVFCLKKNTLTVDAPRPPVAPFPLVEPVALAITLGTCSIPPKRDDELT